MQNPNVLGLAAQTNELEKCFENISRGFLPYVHTVEVTRFALERKALLDVSTTYERGAVWCRACAFPFIEQHLEAVGLKPEIRSPNCIKQPYKYHEAIVEYTAYIKSVETRILCSTELSLKGYEDWAKNFPEGTKVLKSIAQLVKNSDSEHSIRILEGLAPLWWATAVQADMRALKAEASLSCDKS